MRPALHKLWERAVAICARALLGWKTRLPQTSFALESGRSEIARSRVRAWLSQTPFQP
jgi:hypothetical protein